MKNDWEVRIPTGRWMAGVNHFSTMKSANAFIARWNDVEQKSGKEQLNFVRSGHIFRVK